MTKLTAEAIYEMRGTGEITKTGVQGPRVVQLEPSFDVATLREGAYHVDLNETVEVEEGKTGIIRSLDSLTGVGAFVFPREVGEGTHDELQITLFCLRTVELELGSPIAEVSIEDSLDLDDIEGSIDEKLSKVARYLKAGGVNELP